MGFTQAQYDVHLLPSRIHYIKIELLNANGVVVDRLEGISLSGSSNVSADSLIRRSANITFALSFNLLPSEESKLWVTNRIRLFVGLEDYSGVINYFNQGTYMIKNPSINISKEKTISIELLDKMYLFEGIPLENITKISAGTPISDAMKTVVQILGGENLLLIDSHPYNLPYDMEFDGSQNILDIITELRDLYKNWECYYNLDGYFVFREITNRLNDSIAWDFGIDEIDFRITSKIDIAYDNVKNYVKINGKMDNNGLIPNAIAQNNNLSSQFAIDKIGKRALVISDEKYFNNTQCQSLADYELFRHSNFNEQVSISCIPIYFLDVNNLVNFNSEDEGLVGKYCISSLSIPMDKGEMNFSGYRVYE